MFSRRSLLAGASASLMLATKGPAQVFPPAGYAAPSGTIPFSPEVFRERRQKVMGELKTGIAVVYGGNLVATTSSVEPPFAQDPDFSWLTGIVDEPGTILILAPQEREIREILLLPSREAEVERWNVERLPLGQELERRTGFAKVQRVSALGAMVSTLTARSSKELRYLGPIVSANAPVPPALELYGKIAQRVPGARVVDDSGLLARLRQIKEPREIALMRRAMDATRRGHLAAMRQVRPGWTEKRLKDLIEAEFRAGGGDGLAYDSIVGAGRNAASLHYAVATGTIHPGELILIDAAASVGGYACDVTRTFPVDGRFTPDQRAIYNLVLEAQTAVVAKLKAGVYYDDLSEIARGVFRSAGKVDDFYHGLGHHVGLDVHDAGDLSKPIPAGSVITVEPGLYVQSSNYGVRIEDEYLVTANGCERLSTGIPRTVAEIEAFMAERR